MNARDAVVSSQEEAINCLRAQRQDVHLAYQRASGSRPGLSDVREPSKDSAESTYALIMQFSL